jgi:hypothetical protein
MLLRVGRYVRQHHLSLLALFVALGGTSYAAVSLPANSVGSAQLKSAAVTSKKIHKNAVATTQVRDGSLRKRDFAAGELPAGPKGDPGPRGETGPAGPFPEGNLPSGKTVRGNFFMTGVAAAFNAQAVDSLSFVFALASAPTPHFIKYGDAPPSDCPGTAADPRAAPGHLCVYESGLSGPVGGRDVCGLDVGGSTCPGSNRWGAGVYVLSTAAGRFQSYGTWAATAP